MAEEGKPHGGKRPGGHDKRTAYGVAQIMFSGHSGTPSCTSDGAVAQRADKARR